MTNLNPLVLIGALAAGLGIAWFTTREAQASTGTSSKPVWQWAATNTTPDGEADIYEVWIEEPGKTAYTMGGGAATEFATYEQAKAAAVAYIVSRGATPLEKKV